MEERKGLILSTIIREHIKTGAPVGSGILVDKYKLKISPATVRNEMAELEESGFIMQPHTSAGRVPTEKAFNFYLKNSKEVKLKKGETNDIEKALMDKKELSMKNTAKILAQHSQLAVFWAFHKNNSYYTGVSNLLRQPEFVQSDLIYDISLIIDKVDEVVSKIFDDTDYGRSVLIGSKNPFSDFCGTVLSKYKLGGQSGMFGIIGPMRMDYERNIALVDFISDRLKSIK